MPLVRKPAASPPAAIAATPVLPEALASSNAEERWLAARAAAGMPGMESALAGALRGEQDARVRDALFTSLSRTATPVAVAELLSLLRSDEASLRTGALDALQMLIVAARELLPRLLRDADADVRILSCELARKLPDDEATRELCLLLQDEAEPNVCAAAIEVLAEVGASAALPVLAQCRQRFAASPFLEFAIKIAMDRINSQMPGSRG